MYKVPTFLITLLCCAVSLLAHAQDRPNVVFILSDDHCWMDYSFMGHPHVKTPQLDRLASEGLVYERGYDTASMCRPSLASIVTGLYPHQTAVRGNHSIPAKYIEAFKTMDKKEGRALTRKHSHLMTASLKNAPSMVKQLKANGYATFKAGKWWEGNPLDHGFEGTYSNQIGRKTMKPIYDFVNKAQKDKKPFFIWYGVFQPHTPHNAPDRLYRKYKNIAPNESTARYWANIAWLDETCGQIVNFLKEKKLYDNTLFVYASDNGWLPDPKQVGGYIRSKKEAVEIGVRTPIFITHKNKIVPHRDKETLASTIDIAPTILKACGIEPDKMMSGLDLRKPDLLAKRGSIFVDNYDRDININEAHNLHSDILARVVVNGWYKLIVRPNKNELYDLKNDPDDRKNISAQHPEKVKELSALIDKWLQATPMIFDRSQLFAVDSPGNASAFEIGGPRCAGVKWKLTSIPESLKGFKTYPIERGDKLKPGKGMTVTLSAPTEVYLAVMDRGDLKLDESWEKTNMKLDWMGDHVPFTDFIYKKKAPAGTLKIPGHSGKSGKKKITYGIPHLLIVPSSTQVTSKKK